MVRLKTLLLVLALFQFLILAGCSEKEDAVAPVASRSVAFPLDVDYAAFDTTNVVYGTVTIPESVGSIDSVFFRWEGFAELGSIRCLQFDPPPDVGPVFSFATKFHDMNAWWTASETARDSGSVSGEEGLSWRHFVGPSDRIVDPPWQLLSGRELAYSLGVSSPGLIIDCGWLVRPRGTLESAALVVITAE